MNKKLENKIDLDYNRKDKLENLTLDTEDLDYECVLNKFLVSLSGSNENRAALRNAAESLIYLVNKSYVGKLNFSLCLISHFITGSKSVIELRSRYSPSGSYPTILKYLDKYSKEKLSFPQSSDLIVFFDNNQVLARNWRVKYDCKALVSVVTTLICLIPPVNLQLQRNPYFPPLSIGCIL